MAQPARSSWRELAIPRVVTVLLLLLIGYTWAPALLAYPGGAARWWAIGLAAGAAIIAGTALTNLWQEPGPGSRSQAWGSAATAGAAAALSYALTILILLYVPTYGLGALAALPSLLPVALAGAGLGVAWRVLDVLMARRPGRAPSVA